MVKGGLFRASLAGFGLSVALIAQGSTAVPVPDVEIPRLAQRVYGPGYNDGAAMRVGDGTAKTFTYTTANESGAPISKFSVAFQGWQLRTNGYADASAQYDVTGTIEYPVGTVVGNWAATVLPGLPSASIASVLSTAIPKGASYKITGSSTIATGVTYIVNLGFAGVRNHALLSTLTKAAVGAFGDSIMTNNNSAFYNAALGRCPVYVNSIVGTTALTYAANNGAFFQRQVAICNFLGLTDVACNLGTNDYGGPAFYADLVGYITIFRDMVRAAGMRYNHCTMLCRTQSALLADPVSSLTSVGNVLTAVVPDASKFVVGMNARCTGANQSEYLGSFMVTAIDTAANTVTMLFPGSATPTATGTITLGSWKATSHVAFMTQYSAKYAPGPNSDRGKFNAWVRGGNVDGVIEWGDAVEPFRDAGRWLVGGETPVLPLPELITVSSVTSTTRFNSNYSKGSGTIANGAIQPSTGANTGVIRNGSNNTNGDITVTSAFPQTQVVGDKYWAVPGVCYSGDDGTHVRVSAGGKGGQILLDVPTAAFLDMRNAA